MGTTPPNPHLKGKVPILLRKLVNFAIHLALLCLQVLTLLQSLMETHSEAVRELGQLEKTVAPSLPPHGYRVGYGAGKEAGRIIPLILATELLKLPGLRRAGRLLLVEQS